MRARGGRPLFNPDPGYLFILAGLVLAGAVALVPAVDDRDAARHYRDKALALESFRASTLARHARYLDALQSRDEVLVRSLTVARRNAAPPDRALLVAPPAVGLGATSVLARLEGDYRPPPPHETVDSRLQRLATNPTARLALFACAAMAILYGLLPPATRQGARATARAALAREPVAAGE
jgi:hypothetical protein